MPENENNLRDAMKKMIQMMAFTGDIDSKLMIKIIEFDDIEKEVITRTIHSENKDRVQELINLYEQFIKILKDFKEEGDK